MAGPFFRVGHREILYPRREGLDRKWGDAKKRRERERRSWRWWFPLPYATSAPSPRFSRATLVRVSYYLTLPYGFPLNRECCSLNFIKAVSPSFESCQCYRRKPLLVSRLPASMARVFRVPRNLSSVSCHGFISRATNRPDFPFFPRFNLFREAETLKNNVQGSVQGIRERIRREKGWRNFLKKQQIEEGEISGVIWANGTLTSLDGRSCFVVAWISDRWIAVRIIERYTKYFPRIYSYSEIINYYRFIFRATTVFDYLRAK